MTACNTPSSSGAKPADPGGLWAHDNVVAWEVIPFDSMKRSHEERAAMLSELGIRHYAYLDMGQEPKELPELRRYVDAEIVAMQRHGINLLAWFYWIDTDDPAKDPKIELTLESFKRHDVRPQLWVAQSHADYPKTPEQWASYFPQGTVPKSKEDVRVLSGVEKQEYWSALIKAVARFHKEQFPKTPAEHELRVQREAERIRAFTKLAAPYGCQVHIYNHSGWFGMIENQIQIIERLKQMGTGGVGMVYNFSHARDELHDDSERFPQLWRKMQPYVVVVNVTAMKMDAPEVWYPSQGNGEVEMMRTIQNSGWQGPIGVLVQRYEDARIVLRNDLLGLDWIAAELRRPGSAGPRPFQQDT